MEWIVITTICIIGLGYMGLPTGLLLAKSGYNVRGYDIDEEKIIQIQQGILPFDEKELSSLFIEAKDNFKATNLLMPADVFIITVPTPLTTNNTCQFSYINSALDSLASVLEDGNLVVLESTVPPGTTEGLVKKRLDETKKNYFLSYVSEKAIPGNTIFEMQMNHRIVGGINAKSAEKTKKIYSAFVKAPIHLTDTLTAETVKLLENSYRDINIAFANELAKRLTIQNINAWEAINLANLHPRVNIHKPGPGVGGHCIPIDPWFLNSDETLLMKQARKINNSMPAYVVGLVERIEFNKNNPIIVIFGVSYKADVDDVRESPSLEIKKICEEKNMVVRLFDPHAKADFEILDDLDSATKDADCILLVTDHTLFKTIEPKKITNMNQKIIVDTRNIIDCENWINAGFVVKVIGKDN